MPNETAIQLQNISQRFRIIHDRPDTMREIFVRMFRRRDSHEDFYALRDISLSVHRGETVGIIGRNGSGKSTLLKVMARAYKPTTGRVEIAGRVSTLIELGAGFHPELTGRENIVVNGVLLGFTRREMRLRYSDIVAFAELEGFIDTPIKQYSSGMLTRLGFAIATECDPNVLLVDEILSVGDAPFQEKSFQRMMSFHNKGCTIVIVSHDLGMIERLCSRVFLLEHGALVSEGPPIEVIARYRELCERHASAPAEG